MIFTEVKRGYDPEEVDHYLASLEGVIKSYKEKDNSIKNAIISAQLAADNIIRNAKIQADEYKIEIAHELEKMRTEIERQRLKIQEFHEAYNELVRKYLVKPDEKEISRLNNYLNEIDKIIDLLMNSGSHTK